MNMRILEALLGTTKRLFHIGGLDGPTIKTEPFDNGLECLSITRKDEATLASLKSRPLTSAIGSQINIQTMPTLLDLQSRIPNVKYSFKGTDGLPVVSTVSNYVETLNPDPGTTEGIQYLGSWFICTKDGTKAYTHTSVTFKKGELYYYGGPMSGSFQEAAINTYDYIFPAESELNGWARISQKIALHITIGQNNLGTSGDASSLYLLANSIYAWEQPAYPLTGPLDWKLKGGSSSNSTGLVCVEIPFDFTVDKNSSLNVHSQYTLPVNAVVVESKVILNALTPTDDGKLEVKFGDTIIQTTEGDSTYSNTIDYIKIDNTTGKATYLYRERFANDAVGATPQEFVVLATNNSAVSDLVATGMVSIVCGVPLA